MSRCIAILSRDCAGYGDHSYRLMGHNERRVVVLCGACRKSAEDAGFDPVPVPVWIERGTAKDFTGRMAA